MCEPFGTNGFQTIAEVKFMLDLCGSWHCSVRGRHQRWGVEWDGYYELFSRQKRPHPRQLQKAKRQTSTPHITERAEHCRANMETWQWHTALVGELSGASLCKMLC